MRKATLIITAITFLLASCGKPEEEWNRFYGFTQADVVGHYEANPDQSLYDELPTSGIAVYNNASMDVAAVGEHSLSIHFVIPGKVNKTFSGPIDMHDEDRSDIVLTTVINTTNKEDIWITVYKNDEGQVRFHGRVKRYYYRYDSDTEEYYLYRSDNWGFDVIKE